MQATRRPQWIVAVLLLGAAVALWGATALDWARGVAGPSLAALAFLAVATLAVVFAVGGVLRRVLGGIVAGAGAYVCWLAITEAGEWSLWSGRGAALLGGVLFLAAGLVIALYAAQLPTMGARYQLANAGRRSGDPHKDMWDGLSEGEDPTADGMRS